MKKNRVKVFFILFLVLGVETWLSLSCSSGNNPSGSGSGSGYNTPTPTPVNAETIWANGNTGYFFSQNVALVPFVGTVNNVSTPDPISGDSTSLQFSATAVATPVNAYFLIAAPENPGTYYASGHLQFDIKLEQSSTGTFEVGFGYEANPPTPTTTNTSFYSISASSLSLTSFTHISIALSTFTPNSANVIEPFYIIGPLGVAGEPNAQKAFTIDNIQWTSN